MGALGLGSVLPLRGVPPAIDPVLHGRLHPLGPGKDTITGHWELMGVITPVAAAHVSGRLPRRRSSTSSTTARAAACSATAPTAAPQVLDDFGEQHLETGDLIVYTSADSVLQIAAHVDECPPAELYAACAAAREIMRGEHAVGPRDRPAVPRGAGRLRAHGGPQGPRAGAARALLPAGAAGLRDPRAHGGQDRPGVRGRRDRPQPPGRHEREGDRLDHGADRLARRRASCSPTWWRPTRSTATARTSPGFHGALRAIDAAVGRLARPPRPAARPARAHRRPRLRPHDAGHRPHARARAAAGPLRRPRRPPARRPVRRRRRLRAALAGRSRRGRRCPASRSCREAAGGGLRPDRAGRGRVRRRRPARRATGRAPDARPAARRPRAPSARRLRPATRRSSSRCSPAARRRWSAGDVRRYAATATGPQRRRGPPRGARRPPPAAARRAPRPSSAPWSTATARRSRCARATRVAGVSGRFEADRTLRAVRTARGWRIRAQSSRRRRHPWEVARFVAERSPHFVVLRPALTPADGLVAALEDGYRRMKGVLPDARLRRRYLVVVAGDAHQARRMTAGIRGVASLAAISDTSVREEGEAQRVSHVSSQRLLVVWPAFAPLDADGRRRVVAHELTHASLAGVTSGRTPSWLVEGIAMYVSGDRRAASAADLVRGEATGTTARGGAARAHPGGPVAPGRDRPPRRRRPERGVRLQLLGGVLHRRALRPPAAVPALPRVQLRVADRRAARRSPTRPSAARSGSRSPRSSATCGAALLGWPGRCPSCPRSRRSAATWRRTSRAGGWRRSRSSIPAGAARSRPRSSRPPCRGAPSSGWAGAASTSCGSSPTTSTCSCTCG